MANKGARLPVGIPTDLTPRQREVLALIAEGRTNFDIAQRLAISLEGVKYHVSEILQRLEVDSREEAAQAWRADRRPLRRVSRGIALASPLRLAGWLAGGALAVAVVGLLVVALTGQFRGGDEGIQPATPTGSVLDPTATPGAEPPRLVSCPAEIEDRICEFAALAEGWVRVGETNSLIGGGPFALPETRDDLAALFGSGDGEQWTLRSIACAYVRGEPPEPDCSVRFALVFSNFELEEAGADQAGMVTLGYQSGPIHLDAYGMPELTWQRSLIVGPLTSGEMLPGGPPIGLGYRVYPVEVLPLGQPTPTPVPAVETLGDVEVHELVIGAEATLPNDLVLYLWRAPWAAEANPDILRVYRGGDGTIRTDDLFARADEQLGPLAIVSYAADVNFSTIVAASCTAPDCQGVALGAWEGTFRLVRSTDGGITWETFGEVSAMTFPAAIDGDRAIMREWLGRDANDRAIERYFIHPSGEPVAPPRPFMSPRAVPGIGLMWEPGYQDDRIGAEPARDDDGNVIAALSAVPNLAAQVSGRAADGTYAGIWNYVPDRPADPHPRSQYLGMVDANGDVRALYTPGAVRAFRVPAFAGSGLLVSNAELPLPPGSSRIFYVPAVLIDLTTGRAHALPELFEGLDDRLQPIVRGAAPGRVARVAVPGDCAFVYPDAGGEGTPYRCYVDGVLLKDSGETRIKGSKTWVRVITPDGFEGWADAETLERRPG